MKRTPKGRVLYAITHDNDLCDHLGEFDIRETKREAFDFVRFDEAVYPVAVIPCKSVKQARRIVKWEALPEGEKRFAIAKEIARLEMEVPSLSPAAFRGMRPQRIIDCVKKADAFLKLIGATP